MWNFFLKIVFIFFLSNSVFSQKTINFKMCDKINHEKDNNFYKMSLVNGGDTIFIPELSKNLFSLSFPLSMDSVDYENIKIHIETCKYIYVLAIDSKTLKKCNKIRICISKEKVKGLYEFNYYSCDGLGYVSYCERIKKKG